MTKSTRTPRRRSFRASAVAGIAAACAFAGVYGALPASATGAASPWSQTGYNAAQSRANLTETTLTSSTVQRAVFRRSVTAPAPLDCSAGVAGPVLTGGQMIAVMAGVVTDYDAATGRVRWKSHQFPDRYWSLAVSNGVVLATSLDCGSASDPNGTIQAFSLATGNTLWSAGAPAGGGLVVSGGYAIQFGESQGSGLTVTAYHVSTGAVAWRKGTCGGEANAIVVAGRVLLGTCDSNGVTGIEADDLATGSPVWTHGASWQFQRGDTDNTATGHHIYMQTSTGTIVDVNPKNGALKFALAGATSVDVVDSTRSYAECGTGKICGYDIAAGGRLWRVTGAAPVAEAGGALYLSDGNVLDAANGRHITRLTAGQGPAAIGDGRLAIVQNARTIALYGLPGS